MSDLVKDLLSQYYGLGAESSGKRCMSIHRSIENARNEEEKQVTEQASLTNEENTSDEEFQKDEDENRKLSIADESYPRPSRVLDSMEDAYDSDETFDVKDIDFGPNIMCNIFENVLSEQSHEQLPDQLSVGDVPSDYIKPYIEDRETEINEVKDNTKSDLDLSFVEDSFPDNTSEASSTTAKESRKSSKSSINLPPLAPKKEPVCNEIFVDFSSMDLKQFPSEILNNFSQLRMLYLSNNNLVEIPGEVFNVLKYLEWLDVRNNQLSSLPASIKRHMCLQTILLQQNKVENLPLELCTLPNLKTLQVTQNPLVMPPKDIVASGCAAILTFLRIEWNNAHPEERVEPKEKKIEPKLSTILCYQSPRKNKKKLVPLKDVISNKNVSTREKRKSYKPSNRCENKGPNIIVEHRLLWFSKLRELFARQTAILQKVKDETVLKEWRRDKRSYSKAMAKAMKRNEDDIPFGFDIEDYASIFKQNSKLKNLGLKKKNKQKFLSPTDINKKINELLESLNKLEINTTDEITPRTKQNLFKNEIEKILQFQSEIQNLRKYNDVATLKN
ncbi:E3 ubiquitin-protein ligase LRSAM1-like isoform X1 [Frieseomelitta varia]|uniref:E3 ubiquitin-protein ligase LRSAM1-like isoform X1 n=1 Tax=Frieseomelitta varia TaxID=561572 RepID=UPI001CB6A161|nr:E3 ubiquitin-protein ligase LRSAM1-like isoform X1 [Frieseomelitta varia]